ncbi:hypothetical protein DQ384_31890 [Sphaerisporangium album]|uniref:MFS transporter n=1 Tax=Sphaerisporangium album TaxID=509200 RepID=A0A367F5F2_9ACTN|nr:hypothetical protein [Sphaerisporangium album]RCG24965.1 hypothetical protein DQ384_31890 [Sphaerisporangium album]
MAVPPIQATGLTVLGRVNRLPLLLDVVVGLLTALALPLAIVAIPNTISVVSALLPPDIAGVGILRAHGLALPVMLCAVPLTAAALGRFAPAPVLVAGLALLAVADVAGGFAGSTVAVGVLRVLHGVAAGVLVPATFAACRERPGAARGVLMPIWAASLAVAFLAAQALALWPLDQVTSWRVTLQPYPLLTGVALVLAAAYFTVTRLTRHGEARRAEQDAPEGSPGLEAADGDGGAQVSVSGGVRGLACTVGPSAGIAVLAFGTTFGWPPGLIVVVAAAAVVALLAAAFAGRVDGAGGRVVALVMIAVGLVVLPTSAQLTYVELGGLGGPGLSGLWVPFGLAALLTFVAASAVGRLGEAQLPKLVGAGLVTMVVGLCAIRLLAPTASGMPLVVPFTLMAGGAAVAVVSALRGVSLSGALFGLSLCFPAVLSGFLLGTGVQVDRLRAVSMSGQVTSEAMVDGFVGALHVWALVAGFAVVIILVLGAVLATRTAERAMDALPPVAPVSPDDDARDVAEEPQPVAEGVVSGADDGPDPGTVMIPVVPAPTRSPEAGAGADGNGDGAGAR